MQPPPAVPDSWFGWVGVSAGLSVDQIIEQAGFDHGMFIEFTQLCMKVMLATGIPTILILCPIHYFLGGGAAGDDNLSKIGFANVVVGSWTCWFHPFFVWYTVVVIQWLVFSAQRKFIARRQKWLLEMPEPRVNSVLIEEVPEEKRTPQKLKDWFEREIFRQPSSRTGGGGAFQTILPGRVTEQQLVKEVHFVKDVTQLAPLVARRDELEKELKKTKGPSAAADRTLQIKELKELSLQIRKAQGIVLDDDSYNTSSAFVTFTDRQEAYMVQRIFSPEASESITAEAPPDPADVIWADFLVDENAQWVRNWIGYVFIGVIFFTFLPLVILISAATDLENLENTFDWMAGFIAAFPLFATLWDALMGSFALTIMLGFLPTLLGLDFSVFWQLKHQGAYQIKIQKWYFFMLVVFTILITAVGSSLISTLEEIIENPLSVFGILAATLPSSTHFYLNWFTAQWTTIAMQLTRYMQAVKFCLFRQFYGDQDANDMAEPEDQDYYGMGSRSARFSLFWVTAIVFLTLSPTIGILCFIQMALARVIFSYLFVYCESLKTDMGGFFWYSSLKAVQQGSMLYVVIMTACLLQRAANAYPAIICFCSLFFLAGSYYNFVFKFQWQHLDWSKMAAAPPGNKISASAKRNYLQPELCSKDVFDDAPKAQSFWSCGVGQSDGNPFETQPAY